MTSRSDSMRSEADVRGVLTRALRANGALAQPIESGTTGLGIPDLFVRTTRVSAWVELKYARYEPSSTYEVTFREGQYGWLKRYYELGGTSVLGIWTPAGLHCFKNESIKQYYSLKNLDLIHQLSGIRMASVSGATFIEWINDPID